MVSPVRSQQPRQAIILTWLVLLGLLVTVFAAVVLTLNATLYSAGGFVGSYLSSLARHDVDGALALPGVATDGQVPDDLLQPSALGELDDIRQLSDDDTGDGLHYVRFEYSLGGTRAESTFSVQHTGTRMGLFSTWTFTDSPISVLQITPMHERTFAVNGQKLIAPEPGATVSFEVLTPGRFEITHSSRFLSAEPVSVPVTRPTTTIAAQLDIQANDQFVEQVQKQVDEYLDGCVTQEVLFPTGCPFGQAIANKVESTPVWSITSYPVIVIEPGETPGTWVVPDVPAAAHLTVDVRSLFDGTLSTFDEDVPFSLHWVMTIDQSGNVTTQPL